jgi:transposase InsO family protein
VWKVLCRHGLNTRAKRLGLIAGYAAPYEPPRDPGPEQHIDVSEPDELVGIDSFYVGRLKGAEGAIWQLTAIDLASSYAWAELVICKQGNPTARQTSKLAERVARELKAAGWQLQRMLSDNGNEFRGTDLTSTLEKLGARHSRIHAGRPQTNGNVEALHKTLLDECWRPAFARYIYPSLHRAKKLNTYLRFYNNDRIHHRRRTQRRIPQRSSTVPERWRQDEPHLSAHRRGCPLWCVRQTPGAEAARTPASFQPPSTTTVPDPHRSGPTCREMRVSRRTARVNRPAPAAPPRPRRCATGSPSRNGRSDIPLLRTLPSAEAAWPPRRRRSHLPGNASSLRKPRASERYGRQSPASIIFRCGSPLRRL